MCQLFTEFCENKFYSFCVILLANKQTNKQGENATSLAEIIKVPRSLWIVSDVIKSAYTVPERMLRLSSMQALQLEVIKMLCDNVFGY